MQLKGKTVLITGGGSGIGRATAVALNAQGCRVVILGQTASKLATVPEATGLVCDITDRTQVQTAITAIHEQFGPVDILINNAGIQYNGEAPSTDQRIDTEIAVNLSAPVKLFSRLYNDLARRPGTAVVNVTSLLTYAPRRRTLFGDQGGPGLMDAGAASSDAPTGIAGLRCHRATGRYGAGGGNPRVQSAARRCRRCHRP